MMEERRLKRERAETPDLVDLHTHAYELEEPRGGFNKEEDEEIWKRVMTLVAYRRWCPPHELE